MRSDLLSPAFSDASQGVFAIPHSPSFNANRKSVAHRKQQQHRRREAAASAAAHRRSHSDVHNLRNKPYSQSAHALMSPSANLRSASRTRETNVRSATQGNLYGSSQDHSPSTSRVPLLDREATGLIMHTERHHGGTRSRASSATSQLPANVTRPPAVPISGGISTVRHRPDSMTRHFIHREQRAESISADHSITSSHASFAQEERHIAGPLRALPSSPSSDDMSVKLRGSTDLSKSRQSRTSISHVSNEVEFVSYSDSGSVS